MECGLSGYSFTWAVSKTRIRIETHLGLLRLVLSFRFSSLVMELPPAAAQLRKPSMANEITLFCSSFPSFFSIQFCFLELYGDCVIRYTSFYNLLLEFSYPPPRFIHVDEFRPD